MAYTKGPYAAFSSLPSEPRPIVGASRAIDFATGSYVFDDATGGFESMPSIAQRACIAVALSVPRGGNITAPSREATRLAILNAIDSMVRARLMSNVRVTVERTAPGFESRRLEYTDTSTGLDQRVQLP